MTKATTGKKATEPKPAPSDTDVEHHPSAAPEAPGKQPRPGAKGQPEPRARKRVVARQRGPR